LGRFKAVDRCLGVRRAVDASSIEFERRLSIPANVDADKVDAKLTDGVLEVRLPKVKPVEPEVKKIEIKSE
jgi:HSP20 family protein